MYVFSEVKCMAHERERKWKLHWFAVNINFNSSDDNDDDDGKQLIMPANK